jgi:hypothetical protein
MFYYYKNKQDICKKELSRDVTQHIFSAAKSLIFVKDKKNLPLYQSIYHKNYELISLNDFVIAIKTGKVCINGEVFDFKPLIEKIREANKKGDAQKKSEYKKRLPAVLVSVILPQGAQKTKDNIKEFTGLIQVDFDHVQNLPAVKSELKNDPYTFIMFTSPSGDGLKLIVKIDTSKNFENIFYGLAEYYQTKYNLTLDKQTKNPNRLMFLSYDNDVFVNPHTEIFKKTITKMEAHSSETKELSRYSNNLLFNRTNIIEKVFENVAFKILNAPDGERHDTVLKQAKLIGGFVGRNLISYEEAKRELFRIVDIMETNNRKDKYRAVEDGLSYGIKEPVKFEIKRYVPLKIFKTEKALKDTEKLKIEYDVILKAKEKVSEVSDEILQLINENKKILIQAQTGTGKTYAIINEIAPNLQGKVIIAVPYIRLAEQIAKQYNIPAIHGETEEIDIKIALENKIVVATYNQAVRYAKHFDYLIIDEAHNLTASYGYRKDVIIGIKDLADDIKTVAITATPPAELLKKIGFIYVKIEIPKKAEKVTVRKGFYRPSKTALNHFLNSKQEGKKIALIKSKEEINILKKELIKHGLAEETEILTLTADVENNSPEKKAFLELTEKQRFPEKIKYILATNVIMDGINIYDKDVTEVLFLQNQFVEYPEEIKQFFARFRDHSDIDFYLYVFEKKDKKEVIDYNAEYIKIFAKAKELSDSITKTIKIISELDAEEERKYTSFFNQDKFITKKNDKYVVNTTAVLAEAYKNFVNSFNLSDYLVYLQNNFQINFDLSSYYFLYEITAVEIDKKEAIKLKQQKDLLFFEGFVKYFDDVLIFAVKHITKDELLKKISFLRPISALKIENYSPEFEKRILPVFLQNTAYVEKLLFRYFRLTKYFAGYNEIKDKDTHLVLISFIFTTDKEGNITVRGNAPFHNLIAKLDTHFLLTYKEFFRNKGGVNEKTLNTLEELINLLNEYKGIKLTSNEIAELVKTAVPEAINQSFYKEKHYIKTVKTLFCVEEKRSAKKRFYILKAEKDHKKAMEELINYNIDKLKDFFITLFQQTSSKVLN